MAKSFTVFRNKSGKVTGTISTSSGGKVTTSGYGGGGAVAAARGAGGHGSRQQTVTIGASSKGNAAKGLKPGIYKGRVGTTIADIKDPSRGRIYSAREASQQMNLLSQPKQIGIVRDDLKRRMVSTPTKQLLFGAGIIREQKREEKRIEDYLRPQKELKEFKEKPIIVRNALGQERTDIESGVIRKLKGAGRFIERKRASIFQERSKPTKPTALRSIGLGAKEIGLGGAAFGVGTAELVSQPDVVGGSMVRQPFRTGFELKKQLIQTPTFTILPMVVAGGVGKLAGKGSGKVSKSLPLKSTIISERVLTTRKQIPGGVFDISEQNAILRAGGEDFGVCSLQTTKAIPSGKKTFIQSDAGITITDSKGKVLSGKSTFRGEAVSKGSAIYETGLGKSIFQTDKGGLIGRIFRLLSKTKKKGQKLSETATLELASKPVKVKTTNLAEFTTKLKLSDIEPQGVRIRTTKQTGASPQTFETFGFGRGGKNVLKDITQSFLKQKKKAGVIQTAKQLAKSKKAQQSLFPQEPVKPTFEFKQRTGQAVDPTPSPLLGETRAMVQNIAKGRRATRVSGITSGLFSASRVGSVSGLRTRMFPSIGLRIITSQPIITKGRSLPKFITSQPIITKGRSLPKFGTIFKPVTDVTLITDITSKSDLIFRQSLITSQIGITTGVPPGVLPPPPPGGGFFPPFGFEEGGSGSQFTRKRRGRGTSFRGKVTPSLVAVVQRIRGKQIRPGRVTGLEIRPMRLWGK